MNTHWSERLSEYQDGELTAIERAACEAHLAACDTCRATLEEIRSAIAQVANEPARMPTADLWPGILARIQSQPSDTSAPSSVVQMPARSPRAPRRISFTLPQLALAASLLIAVSAAAAYLAAGRSLDRATPQAATEGADIKPIQAVAEPTLPPAPDIVPANFADAQFDSAVADLERILVDQRNTLDPRTVIIIERNLAAIDEAIRQARAALNADPANPFLNSHLADARRRKLDLLRQAAALGSAGGD